MIKFSYFFNLNNVYNLIKDLNIEKQLKILKTN